MSEIKHNEQAPDADQAGRFFRRALTRPRGERGIALVIVLAFVVLLTGLVIAYFARTITDRQLSNSSYNQAAADQLARSALSLVTGNLKQEIVNGSTVQMPGANWPAVYLSTTNSYMIPMKNGVPSSWAIPWTTANTTLLRVSSTTGITFPGVDQTASNASSTGTSANGRSISPARWNQHYLIPLTTSAVAVPSNPIPSPSFIAPSWVYVTSTGGPAQLTAPSPSVVGRYAYAIYDEGALLDVNAAGFPCDPTNTEPTYNGTMPAIYQAKGGSAYADLTSFFTTTTGPTQAGVNTLIAWRNYASLNPYISPGSSFPSLSFVSGTNILSPFRSLISSNTNGFLTVTGSTTANNLTDQTFLTRQELINVLQAIGSKNFNLNNLQYLGTFSRAIAAPSWSPPADSTNLPGYKGGGTTAPVLYKSNAENSTGGVVNRDLANVRFQQGGNVAHYTDGIISGSGTMLGPMTSATYVVNAGDPLLQSRFSLAKIAWLSQADPNAGTAPSGSYPQAIQACFGLAWGTPTGGAANGGNPCWIYVGPTGSVSNPAQAIETLDQVAAENPPREPNFFELLKTSILNGSLGVNPGVACYENGTVAPFERGNTGGNYNGSYIWNGPSYPGDDNLFSYSFDRVMYTPPAKPVKPVPAMISDTQIIQIGANIIDQYDADSYPTAIYFKYSGITPANDAAANLNQVFGQSDMVYGDENLPYMLGIVHIFATTDGGPHNVPKAGYDGKTHPFGCWWQPLIWNPHQMPNPANSSFPAPQKYQINGYTANGGIKFFWGDAQYSGTNPLTPPQALPSNSTDPQQLSDPGTGQPLQYISFIDTSPSNSAFYAQPLLLTSSGIPNVTATSAASYPQMMATTYPNIYHESQNPFVGFWAGTDDKYMGGTVFINVESQAAGAATFALGWVGNNGNFHPYSFLPGQFAIDPYGVVDNGPRDGTQDMAGALPGDSATSDDMLVDPLTTRFGNTANWSVGGTNVYPAVQSVSTAYPNSSTHNGDTYAWGQPYSSNFIYDVSLQNAQNPGIIYGYYLCDWEVNQPQPVGYTGPTKNGGNWIPTGPAGATPTYYLDPDGVVRPGDGVLANSSKGDGMLLYTVAGTASTNYASASGDTTTATSAASGGNTTGNSYHGRRQIILNRPFRSVGELGYAYRDLPFKTLDFFTTSSADAALLDVFGVSDQSRVVNGQLNSVVAGEVTLSDAPAKVITALLAGGSKKDFDGSYYYSNSGTTPIKNPATATTLGKAIVTALNPPSGPAPALTNRADLVTSLGANMAALGAGTSGTGAGIFLSAISLGFPNTPSPDVSNKAYLEGPVRALADATNTRTWNLMIDVIAQAGSFSPGAPANSAALNSSFNVQGERRYWLHIAIDRTTGKVIDEQLEPVYE